MSSPSSLPALPGAADDAGSGPVEPPLLDKLLGVLPEAEVGVGGFPCA